MYICLCKYIFISNMYRVSSFRSFLCLAHMFDAFLVAFTLVDEFLALAPFGVGNVRNSCQRSYESENVCGIQLMLRVGRPHPTYATRRDRHLFMEFLKKSYTNHVFFVYFKICVGPRKQEYMTFNRRESKMFVSLGFIRYPQVEHVSLFMLSFEYLNFITRT